MEMYTTKVEDAKLIKCIPSYSLNQDAVEIFFGKCRSLHGYNDNPTVQQVQSAIRKILVHSTVCTSKKANCTNYDVISEPFSSILYISPNSKGRPNIQTDATPDELEVVIDQLHDIEVMDSNGVLHTSCTDATNSHRKHD